MNLLKISFLLFFIIPTAILANDDYLSVNYFDLNSYKVELRKTEFDTRFKSDEDKKDFKKLREFLNEKQDLENDFSIDMDNFHYYKLVEGVSDYDRVVFKLDKKIKKAARDTIEFNINEYEKYFENQNYDNWGSSDESSNEEELISLSKEDVKDRITSLEKIITKCKTIEKALSDNLKNVRSDIYKCRNQIASALAPEYKRQEFRKDISLYFSILIGLLIGAFFLVVYLRSDKTLSQKLLGENGLKFITLFVLIIAIILFGILGILEGRELSAIISGISGYILGKGVAPPTPSTTSSDDSPMTSSDDPPITT